MKCAFLPHFFKKIGLACFFVAALVILTASLISTQNLDQTSEANKSEYVNQSAYTFGHSVGRSFAGYNDNLWFFKLCSAFLVAGIAFYFLAKEKREDEYLVMIRWESIRLSILICIGILLLCILSEFVIRGRTLLFILFISYLITFKIKKLNSINV